MNWYLKLFKVIKVKIINPLFFIVLPCLYYNLKNKKQLKSLILYFLVYSLFTLFSINELSAQVNCKGKIENLPPNVKKKIAVEYWTDDWWMEMDTISLNADNSFEKSIPNKHLQARFRIWGRANKWIDFLVPQNPDKDFVLDFGIMDYNKMNGGPARLSGQENEAYFDLMTTSQECQLLNDSLESITAKTSLQIASFKNKLDESRRILNDKCKKISLTCKGSFIGDVLANILYYTSKNDLINDSKDILFSDQVFDRKHFLDNVPFNDKRVLSHISFIKKLYTYSQLFPKSDSLQLISFVDRLMNKRQGNEEVNAWIFHYLLFKFVNEKDEISLNYLLRSYSDDCALEEHNSDKSVKTLISALKNCEVGKTAFKMFLPDTSGNNTSLANIALNNKLTLLFFWRSDCSHCREFEPELVKIYNKYRGLGLEIIGISMDISEASWKKYLLSNPMSWINLHIATFEQRSQIRNNFPVPATPTLIAVDKNFTVRSRLINRVALEKYLDQELKN